MKTVWILLLCSLFTLTACSDQATTEEVSTPILDVSLPVDSTSMIVDTTTVEAEPVAPAQEKVAIPTFSNPEVGTSIADYQKIKDQYIAALKAQDALKIQELNMEYMTWYQRTEDIVAQLKGEELKAYKEVLAQLNKQWEVAAEQATK